MKIYSNDAVTSSAVKELDEKQTQEINKLKRCVQYLVGGEIILLAISVALYLTHH